MPSHTWSGVRALPLNTPERRNAWWKYPLQLDLERLLCGGEEVRKAVAAEGIPDCGGQWPESYREPIFAGRASAGCPRAEELRERTLVLGLPPTWEHSHIELCVAAVKKVLRVLRR